MSIQFINTGTGANAGNGDSLRTAFNKINANFTILSTGTASSYVLTPATASTLGGIKIGVGLEVSPDGTLSATGTNASTVINVLDQNNNPSIDIVSYSGTATLSSTNVLLFNFNKTIYRSASVEISANNTYNQTDDIATGYGITWTANVSKIFGLGPVAMDNAGNTANAEWDLRTSNYGNNINVNMIDATGGLAVGHTINWRAKVSLFRL